MASGERVKFITVRHSATRLDEKGRCCGRKPLTYKRDPHFFCTRCDRAFDLDTGAQISNWAYAATPEGDFMRSVPA